MNNKTPKSRIRILASWNAGDLHGSWIDQVPENLRHYIEDGDIYTMRHDGRVYVLQDR